MKIEVLFNHNNFYPKYGPNIPVPVVIIPMVAISISSLVTKEKNNLGIMHKKNT